MWEFIKNEISELGVIQSIAIGALILFNIGCFIAFGYMLITEGL